MMLGTCSSRNTLCFTPLSCLPDSRASCLYCAAFLQHRSSSLHARQSLELIVEYLHLTAGFDARIPFLFHLQPSLLLEGCKNSYHFVADLMSGNGIQLVLVALAAAPDNDYNSAGVACCCFASPPYQLDASFWALLPPSSLEVTE